jgi:rhamnosyltransferase
MENIKHRIIQQEGDKVLISDKLVVIGALILYNPDVSVIDNIQSFISDVAELLIVDNSDKSNPVLVEELKNLPKVRYIDNNGNLGIAKALNIAAAISYNAGFKWMLTMDQDSLFTSDGLSVLICNLHESYKMNPNVALITPQHDVVASKQKLRRQSSKPYPITSCMTSGNIINLDSWKFVGGFKDKLFIDYVDHEYCLRLKTKGKVIMQDDNVVLNHKLGDVQTFAFFGERTASHHNYIRRYYITRNRLYILSSYYLFEPGIALKEVYSLLAETFKIIIKEEDKGKKILSTIRGIKDFFMGHYGKYRYNK